MRKIVTMLFFFLVISCRQEHEEIPYMQLPNECMFSDTFNLISNMKCGIDDRPTWQWCERIPSDSIYELSETSLSEIPYLCEPILSRIRYTNEDGRQAEFELRSISTNVFTNWMDSGVRCDTIKPSTRQFCVHSEHIYLIIESEDLDIRFNIRLYHSTQGLAKGSPLNIGEQLFINFHDPSGPSSWSVRSQLVHTINAEKMDSADIIDANIGSKEIGIRVYDDVYYNNDTSTINGHNFHIYYNRNWGIISFVDEAGKQWNIDH